MPGVPYELMGTKDGIVSFSKYVFSAFELGDEDAREILKFNTKEIAYLIKTAARHIKMPKPYKAVITGSLIKEHPFLVDMIKQNLDDDFIVSVCTEPPFTALCKKPD